MAYCSNGGPHAMTVRREPTARSAGPSRPAAYSRGAVAGWGLLTVLCLAVYRQLTAGLGGVRLIIGWFLFDTRFFVSL